MVTMSTNECQNIASAIVINFEECNVTLLQTKILKQSHVDQQTIEIRLNEIETQSRSMHMDISISLIPLVFKLQYFSSFSLILFLAVSKS